MVKVDQRIAIAAPPTRLFDLLADPLRFPELLSAFPRVELVSERGRCLGARYFMLMQVGRFSAGSVQRLTAFVRPQRMAFHSESGIELRGSVSIQPLDPPYSELRIALEYWVPGLRLPARIVERMTRHIVERQLRATLLAVKRIAEFELDDRARLETSARPSLIAQALTASGGTARSRP